MHKRTTRDQLSELRIGRALCLRMLLASAAARLQPWTDKDTLESMPLSRLLEWTAHDFELLELAELESAMTSMEAGRYAQAFLPGERFLAE